ncbi:BBM_1a_G0019590.mRNA.1.CDS.1 [Saccharomyces cerevisiae]|nr:BBM_1a_G0019590.mRNA.1.CDS.1 [Saccharomyces cerevisiae]CAI7118767.1 BBM_1a_G0019590.mRNA.1.CDS.1 [Saccharomyces cerevisiae]
MPTSGTTIELIDDQFPKDDSASSGIVDEVDLTEANILATGLNKKAPRIVNGFGSLMGSKEMVSVEFDKKGNEKKSNLDRLLEKDNQEKEEAKTKIHISEQPWTLNNWHQHLNWLNMVLVCGMPMIGWYFALSGKVPLHLNVFLFSVFYYAVGGVSITAGYHRLWSHRSYSAHWPLRLFYAIFGCASVEGSAKWWGHSHRIHHRYTDTLRDPYDARRGLWYSHMGWMLLKPNPKYKARADITDMTDDWTIRFQHRHYILLMLLTAFVIPTLICGYFFNDYMGGLIYAGLIRVFVIQQATFCINSMAHYIGTQPFDDRRTPRDNWITAIVTFGEGYHNFHHEFPTDYRNAIKWYQYDPTKVIIYLTSLVGLAYDLKKFSQNAIEEALIQQEQKKINKKKAKINWGPVLTDLPMWDKQTFLAKSKENKGLVIISGIVHDVSGYISEHPGGETLIKTALGKDATKAFSGGVYRHSNAAQNVLADMRVAVIKESKNSAIRMASKRGEIYETGKFF